MCAHVPLQVKGVVEAFAAVPARVPLDKAVALQVSRQHALKWENLMAHRTLEVSRAGGRNLTGGTRQGERDLILKRDNTFGQACFDKIVYVI